LDFKNKNIIFVINLYTYKIMRHIYFIICLFYSVCLYSQAENRYHIYTDIWIGLGTSFDLSADINYMFRSGYSIGISHTDQFIHCPDVPKDYKSGMFGGVPMIKINSFSIMAGKLINTKTDNIKINLRAGIFMGDCTEPVNFRYISGWGFGTNYTYDKKKTHISGVVLNPRYELIFRRKFGFTLGLYSCISSVRTTVSAEIGLIYKFVKISSSSDSPN
jgi:hypothetical protein